MFVAPAATGRSIHLLCEQSVLPDVLVSRLVLVQTLPRVRNAHARRGKCVVLRLAARTASAKVGIRTTGRAAKDVAVSAPWVLSASESTFSAGSGSLALALAVADPVCHEWAGRLPTLAAAALDKPSDAAGGFLAIPAPKPLGLRVLPEDALILFGSRLM